MRRSFSVITGAATASLIGMLMLTACIEGPEGPAGATGATGETGATGLQGAAGSDANQNCTQCHDADTRIKVRQIQWEASVHATGGNFRRGSSATCAACHAHEGFVDRIAAGTKTASQGFDNPSPINCRTCHQIHTTYTDADYNLTTSAPVDLWIDGTGTTVDFGKGNLCANCHQARDSYLPLPIPGDAAPYPITSTHFGPHHSPQGVILAGVGGVEITGLTYPTGPFFHGAVATNPNGCVTCHMATAYGDQAGGHTMEMRYGTDSPNLAGCETSGCHTSPIPDDWEDLGYLGFDYKLRQTDVQADLDALQALLETIGILSVDSIFEADGVTLDHLDPEPVKSDTWTADEAGALWNWLLVWDDRSRGVHHPTYVSTLLKNSITAVTP